MINFIKQTLFIAFFSLFHHAQAESQLPASAFVESLGRDAINTLTNSTLPRDQIRNQFRTLLLKGFAIQKIAQFVLGKDWRKLSQDQQSQFVAIFQKRLENAYADRFKEYQGVVFAVKGERQENDGGFVVNSTIQKPGGPLVNVDWKIYSKDGAMQIYDVTIDGVSMSITQRSDYNAALQSAGNNVDQFLQNIQK